MVRQRVSAAPNEVSCLCRQTGAQQDSPQIIRAILPNGVNEFLVNASHRRGNGGTRNRVNGDEELTLFSGYAPHEVDQLEKRRRVVLFQSERARGKKHCVIQGEFRQVGVHVAYDAQAPR